MTADEQTAHLADELDKLINRFTIEYDISYAVAVGVLQMKIHLLCCESYESGDESETGLTSLTD